MVDRGADKPASAGWQQACDITAAADFDICHEKIARTRDTGSRSHEIDRARVLLLQRSKVCVCVSIPY